MIFEFLYASKSPTELVRNIDVRILEQGAREILIYGKLILSTVPLYEMDRWEREVYTLIRSPWVPNNRISSASIKFGKKTTHWRVFQTTEENALTTPKYLIRSPTKRGQELTTESLKCFLPTTHPAEHSAGQPWVKPKRPNIGPLLLPTCNL